MSGSPRPHSRFAAKHEIQLLALPKRSRQVHRLLRFPERKEFRPSAFSEGDPGTAQEHSDRELLQLWRAHRSGKRLRVHALPLPNFDPGFQTSAKDALAA